jgi:hypothetical protein
MRTVTQTVASTPTPPVGAAPPPQATSGQQACVGHLPIAYTPSDVIASYVDCPTAVDVAGAVMQRCIPSHLVCSPDMRIDRIAWSCFGLPKPGGFSFFNCQAADHKTAVAWRVYPRRPSG